VTSGVRCCNLETAFFSFYDRQKREGERGKDKRNYGCCHEAINWKFAEFSPSPLLFLAQYLFAHCALFSDEFNGFELRAREPKKSLGKSRCLKPQRIASEGRFLPSSQQLLQLSIGYGERPALPLRFHIFISQLHLTFSISCETRFSPGHFFHSPS
jgi:hypothetical protein